jgi:hypothetical protein
MIATTLLKRLEDCMWQMHANVKIMEKSVFSMKSMFDDVSLFGISKTHESYIFPYFLHLEDLGRLYLDFKSHNIGKKLLYFA